MLLEIGKTPYDQLVVLDQFHQSESHVEDAIQWLDENQKPDGTIHAEHVPPELEKFKRAGWRTVKAEKDIDAGLSEVRCRLQPDGNMDAPKRAGGGDVLAFRLNPKGRSGPPTSRIADGENDHANNEARVGLLVASTCQHLIREFLGKKRTCREEPGDRPQSRRAALRRDGYLRR